MAPRRTVVKKSPRLKPILPSPRLTAVTPLMWRSLRKGILKIEGESFPPTIADSEEDLLRVAKSRSGIFLALRVPTSNKVVGYIAADSLERFPDIPGTAADPHFKRGNTVYLESVAIHPDWRGRGLGKTLIQELLRRASKKGMDRATAHVAHGSARRISSGTRVLKSFKNWYDTGRTFDYVEFPIAR